MHQQRSGLVPETLAFSMAQTFGSWQIGQRVGSIVSISPKPISLDGCFQSRISQTLESLLCSLCLLAQAFLLDSILGSFTGGAELINSQLTGCFGFDQFKDSHISIYDPIQIWDYRSPDFAK
jgi:hypothetical protein